MKLKPFKIGEAVYFCNEMQIEAAGSLEAAAKRMHDKANPIPTMKPKAVKVKESEPSGEMPEEK
jgi:hypothetical protein